MIKKVYWFLFVPFLWVSLNSYAQESNIAIGAWRVHLPYQDMSTIAASNTHIYAANGSSIMLLDKEDNSLEALSKSTGLNDVRVSKMAYNKAQDIVVVGYESGNIDLLKSTKVENVNDIARTNIVGSKKINHILCYENLAYLSCDFGVVVYDLAKREVKESYRSLATGGAVNAVFSAAITNDGDSIFLTTARGVMCGRRSQTVNLMDFSNWYTYGIADSITTTGIGQVAVGGGYIYASVNNGGGLYYLHSNSKWRKSTLPIRVGATIRSLTNAQSNMLVCVDTAVFEMSSPFSWNTQVYEQAISPYEAAYDGAGTLWAAVFNGGILKKTNEGTKTSFLGGPLTNAAFRFGYYNNTVVQLAGGYDQIGNKVFFGNWFSYFENNTNWRIGAFDYPSIAPEMGDQIAATYNDVNGTLYISSFGGGLVAIAPDKTVINYNNLNSPLRKDAGNFAIQIGETALDKNGNLWIPNRNVSSGLPNLHRLSPKGEWASYVVPSSVAINGMKVTIDDLGYKWITGYGLSGQAGVVVFDEVANRSRTLTNQIGQGALPVSVVNCVTKDRKGAIFVGTNEGLAVCYDPSTIFSSGVDLVKPIFEGFPILFERNVLSIKVDGGNRKWIGTNDGLWLFNEDLTKVIAYFDTENSPLLSDFINDILIQPKTGEVFLATPEGIVSYRGVSTEPDKTYSDVKVFPNPVKPGFNGMIGISGLAQDASVKITDVAGRLVYETKANGGTAIWNVKDYNGTRVVSGVYLIFCSTSDGEDTYVSKISIVE